MSKTNFKYNQLYGVYMVGAANSKKCEPDKSNGIEPIGKNSNNIGRNVIEPQHSDSKSMSFPSTFVPSRVFFTKGCGRHTEKLNSFELALRNAGIAKYNLVRVSSIFPPGCKIIKKKEGLAKLQTGQILYGVISENAANEPNRLVAASIGVAIPADRKHHGYLSEHHSFGQTEHKAGDYAEDLAAEMLATTLGIEFDSDTGYDEKREIYKIDGRIVNSRNITQSAVCDKRNLWTTVIAAAIFLP
jgi:arginine decarboxylase